MDLPPAASAMYKSWWSFVNYAASQVDDQGRYSFGPTDVSSAASEISRTVGGPYASYNPIGVSQLFSVARTIANSSAALNAADASSPITAGMVAEAPWSRSAAEQTALPMFQVRAEVTYLDQAGVQNTGFYTIQIPQVLPSTVGSLQAQMTLRVQDMLAAPEGTGTPRTGQFVAIGPMTLLQV